MNKSILINTGNDLKFAIATDVLKSYGFLAKRSRIDAPEIQSEDGKDISEFSAKYVYAKVKKPVVTTDVSYHIEALNGFPGPYIKYINHWLSAHDLIRLMNGKTDRRVRIVEYLTLMLNKKEWVTFSVTLNGMIANEVIDDRHGSSIDQILILDGLDKPEPLVDPKLMREFYAKKVGTWHQLGVYLQKSYE